MDVLNRVPVREQEPQVRAANFEEVCLGYNEETGASGSSYFDDVYELLPDEEEDV